jgi:hypothetical protein
MGAYSTLPAVASAERSAVYNIAGGVPFRSVLCETGRNTAVFDGTSIPVVGLLSFISYVTRATC